MAVEKVTKVDWTKDNCTASNFLEIQVTHYHLDFAVDFDLKEIRGRVVLDFQRHLPGAKLVLDIRDVTCTSIHAIVDGKTSSSCNFAVNNFAPYGDALVIDCPVIDGAEKFQIEIQFITGQTGALSWLPPAETAGKVHPYLYSMGQACLNRSFFSVPRYPCV